jgi:tRNA A37 methylthiotransferase MiaB
VPGAFGEAGIKLTPRHYAYLKISEGCNHRCTFCIIPSMRGDLVSRPVGDVLKRGQGAVRRRREGTAGHQPGHRRPTAWT